MKKRGSCICLFYILLSFTVAGAQCHYLTAKKFNKISNDSNQVIPLQIKIHIDSLTDKIKTYLGVSFTIQTYNDGKDRNAFASEDGEIILGCGLVNDCVNHDPSLLCLDYVLCHEASHLFQYKDPNNHLASKHKMRDFELQADCLASKMIYDILNLRSTTRFQIMLNYLFTLGDYSFNKIEHHGTPMERYISAFVYWNILSINAKELYKKSMYLFDNTITCKYCHTICHFTIIINNDYDCCVGLDLNIYSDGKDAENGYGNPLMIQGKIIPTRGSTMQTFVFDKYYKTAEGQRSTKRYYVKNDIIYMNKSHSQIIGHVR